jgi:hypothetical protein
MIEMPERPGFKFVPADKYGLIPLKSKYDEAVVDFSTLKIIGVYQWIGDVSK